jgi:hypothetical protein
MEKAAGSSVAPFWPRMSNQEKRDLVQAIVKLETKAVKRPFCGIGSLYYADDIPAGIRKLTALEQNGIFSDRVLGPTTDRRFFDDGRGELSLDRGPCTFTLYSARGCITNSVHRREYRPGVSGCHLSARDGGYQNKKAAF